MWVFLLSDEKFQTSRLAEGHQQLLGSLHTRLLLTSWHHQHLMFTTFSQLSPRWPGLCRHYPPGLKLLVCGPDIFQNHLVKSFQESFINSSTLSYFYFFIFVFLLLCILIKIIKIYCFIWSSWKVKFTDMYPAAHIVTHWNWQLMWWHVICVSGRGARVEQETDDHWMSAQEVRTKQETPGSHQQEAVGLCSGTNRCHWIFALNFHTRLVNYLKVLLYIIIIARSRWAEGRRVFQKFKIQK